MVKILVVRFSSIGDIVLTSSVVRALKTQLPEAEIHFLTKDKFKDLVAFDPNISKVFTIEKDIGERISELNAERYDHLIDLHNNLRTRRLSFRLRVQTHRFPKLNWRKWLFVRFKKDVLPRIHVVERYFEAVKELGVQNRNEGLRFYPVPESKIIEHELPTDDFLTIAIGAQFATKRMPNELLEILLAKIETPIVLLGGLEDVDRGQALVQPGKVYNLCGKLSLSDSARLVEKSYCLLTNDTGMMHIASSGKTPIVSVWGNTVPAFGMFPYRPNDLDSFRIHEVHDLKCRPCSKIGFQECPKGHFKCMKNQDSEEILASIKHYHLQRKASLN